MTRRKHLAVVAAQRRRETKFYGWRGVAFQRRTCVFCGKCTFWIEDVGWACKECHPSLFEEEK